VGTDADTDTENQHQCDRDQKGDAGPAPTAQPGAPDHELKIGEGGERKAEIAHGRQIEAEPQGMLERQLHAAE